MCRVCVHWPPVLLHAVGVLSPARTRTCYQARVRISLKVCFNLRKGGRKFTPFGVSDCFCHQWGCSRSSLLSSLPAPFSSKVSPFCHSVVAQTVWHNMSGTQAGSKRQSQPPFYVHSRDEGWAGISHQYCPGRAGAGGWASPGWRQGWSWLPADGPASLCSPLQGSKRLHHIPTP